MASSKVKIANLALQNIGVSRRIGLLTEDNVEARQVNLCIDNVIESELRRNNWGFAIRLAQLSALSDTPAFGRTYQYQLPANFMRIVPEDPVRPAEKRDWLIANRKIYTDDSAPLNLRYVCNDTPAEHYDPMFVEAVAARIAYRICRAITQSIEQQDRLERAYVYWINEARRTNAIEQGPTESEEDDWITVRHTSNLWPQNRSLV